MANVKYAFRVSFAVLLAVLFWAPVDSIAASKEPAKNSCIECHRNSEEETFSAPVALWEKSAHADVGNTCDGCHGGNPKIVDEEAMSEDSGFVGAPEVEEIVDFCGKCHIEIAKNFKTSTHAEAELRNCVDCHGSHSIQRRTTEIIKEENCTDCHEFDGPKRLKSILEGLYIKFATSAQKITLINGFPKESINKDMAKAWKTLRHIKTVTHTFDLEFIEKEAEVIEEEFNETAVEIDKLVEMVQLRKTIGYITLVVFLILALIMGRYNRELHKSAE